MKLRVEIKTCPKCHGRDLSWRVYGTDPELVLVACWTCAQFSTLTVPTVREMIEWKRTGQGGSVDIHD